MTEWDGASSRFLYKRTIDETGDTGTTNDLGGLTIGTYNVADSRFADISLGEMIVFRGSLTAELEAHLRSYLLGKYAGIQV
jgi:hypothetical protein